MSQNSYVCGAQLLSCLLDFEVWANLCRWNKVEGSSQPPIQLITIYLIFVTFNLIFIT